MGGFRNTDDPQHVQSISGEPVYPSEFDCYSDFHPGIRSINPHLYTAMRGGRLISGMAELSRSVGKPVSQHFRPEPNDDISEYEFASGPTATPVTTF